MFHPSFIKLRNQGQEENSIDPDEAAQNEPPYRDLCCLQIQLFSGFGTFRVKIRAIDKGAHL